MKWIEIRGEKKFTNSGADPVISMEAFQHTKEKTTYDFIADYPPPSPHPTHTHISATETLLLAPPKQEKKLLNILILVYKHYFKIRLVSEDSWAVLSIR